jgi:hypothetical protein
MKHHKWRETIQEKILFLSALQLQEHREKAAPETMPLMRSAPRAAGYYGSASRHPVTEAGGEQRAGHILPWHRSVDGWWIMHLGSGNSHFRYPVDGKPAFDLHAIKLVHNEFYDPISLLAAV